ncbi:FAD-binding oxidoreductase [Prosthecobacter debontii]|nr:FAD-binding oxidoreductase [Prosthecobacter debontii]
MNLSLSLRLGLMPALLLSVSSCSLYDGACVLGRMALERRTLLPIPEAGCTDVSRLHELHQPARVLKLSSNPDSAEQELREFLREAQVKKAHVSIAGARHSMGGQTLGQSGCYTVDMLGLDDIGPVFAEGSRRWVTVEAGARWKDIVPELRKQGYAPKIMQSNSDFSVGGSLSVNCHGWQHNSEPIASTVKSIRVMTADGRLLLCSREKEKELFSLVLGGYGLFGVILEATLEVIPDSYYQAESQRVPPAQYVKTFESMTQAEWDGMAYGRISVAPSSFLEDSVVSVLRPVPPPLKSERSLVPASWLLSVKRGVFRNAVGSDRGKDFRWAMETRYGETGGGILRRSDILSEPASLYGNRDPKATEILHEYFVPKERLADFLETMKGIHREGDCPDLLNITVRNVKTDRITHLRYARQEVFGLVMLFHQHCGSTEDEQQMIRYTQRMIDAVLACGGTFYLPYRLHARLDQFDQAYPNARTFFALKRQYDPHELFQNQLYQRYAR